MNIHGFGNSYNIYGEFKHTVFLPQSNKRPTGRAKPARAVALGDFPHNLQNVCSPCDMDRFTTHGLINPHDADPVYICGPNQ